MSPDQPSTASSADVRAVEELFDGLADTWARADARAFGDLFTDDADYITISGTHFRGRAAIVACHEALWTGFQKDTYLNNRISDLKFPLPDVAIVHSEGGIVKKPGARPRGLKVQTLVAVRVDARWLIAAVHNANRWRFFERYAARKDPRMRPDPGHEVF